VDETSLEMVEAAGVCLELLNLGLELAKLARRRGIAIEAV